MCTHLLSSLGPQGHNARPSEAVSPHPGLREGKLLAATSFLQIRPEVGRFELFLKESSLGWEERVDGESRDTEFTLRTVKCRELVQR